MLRKFEKGKRGALAELEPEILVMTGGGEFADERPVGRDVMELAGKSVPLIIGSWKVRSDRATGESEDQTEGGENAFHASCSSGLLALRSAGCNLGQSGKKR